MIVSVQTMCVRIHNLIGELRGMCSDELPWTDIDGKLVELDDTVHQLTGPDMHGFCEVSEQVIADMYSANARYEAALEAVAAGKRPDGTYNLSREACEQIAREALTGPGCGQ